MVNVSQGVWAVETVMLAHGLGGLVAMTGRLFQAKQGHRRNAVLQLPRKPLLKTCFPSSKSQSKIHKTGSKSGAILSAWRLLN